MLHPTVVLLLWLLAILATQALTYPGLLGLALVVLLAGAAVRRGWGRAVRRARWLLLMLWLIMAYHTPGDAWNDLPWAPTYEGVREANLHALRLALMLGGLAWLREVLGHAGLVNGLWGALQPWAARGVDVGRLVVRLSLVLAYLEQPAARGAWREMLAGRVQAPAASERIVLDLAPWSGRDRLVAALALMTVAGVFWC